MTQCSLYRSVIPIVQFFLYFMQNLIVFYADTGTNVNVYLFSNHLCFLQIIMILQVVNEYVIHILMLCTTVVTCHETSFLTLPFGLYFLYRIFL